jgi:iron complex outermembrane receptor protein
VRHGGLAGASASWRLYAKFAHRDAQRFSIGGSSGDARSRGQAGLRMDGGSAGGTSWMLKADAFQSNDALPDRADGEFSELSLQGRWSRVVSPESRVDLQTYYRREYRRVPGQLTHHVNVIDVDGQHAATLFARHDVVWGGGARVNRDRADGVTVLFDPVERTYPVFNVFVQDQFPLVTDSLSVTAGVKVERNAFSGAETQPNIRARLLLPRNQVLWGAVSRAVRRPTRFETDTAFLGPGDVVLFRGNEDFSAESLVATELGYRIMPEARVSVEATVFVHRYDNLRSQDAPPGGGLPIVIGNSLDGESHGVELALTVQPRTWWRTHAGYTWMNSSIERQPGSRDIGGGVSEHNDPEHLLGIRTSVDLPGNVEVDALLRHVASLPDPPVPAYSELHVRAGWRVTPRAELAVTGHDLLHDQHAEFGSTLPRRVEFQRSVLASLTLRF